MNKRVLFILLPLLVGFSVVSGLYFTTKPYVQTWLLSQVNRITSEKLPLNIHVKEVNWSLLLPEVILSGVSISERPGGLKNIPIVEIANVSASLDLLAIFAGKIAVSSLVIQEPVMKLAIDPYLVSDGPDKLLPINDIFATLKKIPVSRIGIRHASFDLISKKYEQTLSLRSVSLRALNQKERLGLQLDIRDGYIKQKDQSEIPVRLQAEVVVTPKSLDISSLKLNMFNTVANISGSFGNLSRIHLQPEGNLEFDMFAELPQLSDFARKYMKIGNLQGVIKTAGRVEFGSSGLASAGIKFSGQKIHYDEFELGNIVFEGGFKDHHLLIPKIQITNDAGLIDLSQFRVDIKKDEDTGKEKYELSSKAQTELFDLQEFLTRLDLKNIPIEAFISGNLDCKGPLYPGTEITCQGKVSGEQIEVRTGPSIKDTLVNVESLEGQGEAKITDKAVSYKVDLSMGKNQGRSEGNIIFTEGFKIKFSSPEFDFGNLGRTAGLKIEGIAGITGITQGNSDYGVLDVDMTVKNGFFEDFRLGDVSGKLRYEKSMLYFDKLKGSIGDPSLSPKGQATSYQGDLIVNLDKKTVSAKALIPQYEIPHILSVFDRIFKLPVQVTGSGAAEVSVEGPFSLGLLSYQIKTNVERGMAAGETFDAIDFAASSNSGNMKIENAVVRKNRSEIRMTGSSNPDGIIDLKINTEALPLENSENISKIGSQISGLLDAEMTLKGFVTTPDVLLIGKIRNLNIEEQDFPESNFKTELSRADIKGDVNLFSGQLMAQFAYPLNDSSPFLLKAKATDWNYVALFSFFGGGSLLNDYQATLTGNVNLQSPEGGMWASTGTGKFDKLTLERGNLSLKNNLPIELEMNAGIGRFKNFHIESSGADKAFFDVKSDSFSKQDLTMQIKGVTNLRLFQIFVPFLEELGGSVNIDINTAGPLTKPEILGTAQINDGFVKIKMFPHPIERIKSDIQFSQSKILINRFAGNIAGGSLAGDGSVLIEGPQNLPVNVKAKFENVNLNFPEGMRTLGDGELSFSGNWFPYVFSGIYNVRGGFVDKEFQDDAAGAAILKQSSYLPKNVLQSSFEPILLDLNINLERPLTIKNSMVDGTVTGNIIVRGPPSRFSLGGRIATEKGSKALFRDKVFQIQTGNVQFGNTSDMNPEIYLAANSRINQYDIAMLIQGTAKTPIVRLSSTPPLSDQDIISLIALGVTSNRLEKQIDSTQKSEEAMNKAVGGLAAGAVLTQLEAVKKLQQSTGVEIQFSSSNDDTKNVSLQRITLSKKITDNVQAAATQVSGNYSAQEYTLQYNFTESVSAIGRYEDRKANETTTSVESNSKESQSIFGLDLEFKREFK